MVRECRQRVVGVADANDAALLAQHAAGCPRAFATVYARYFDLLVAAARQQGSLDPEDAAQEALTKAAAKAHTYPGRAVCSVATWLRRILTNTVIDAWRVRRSRPTVQLVDDVPAPAPAYEVTRQVKRALADLPVEQAQAIELHYIDGLTAVEISTRLKQNENSVKGRIRLGSAKMRAALTERTADLV